MGTSSVAGRGGYLGCTGTGIRQPPASEFMTYSRLELLGLVRIAMDLLELAFLASRKHHYCVIDSGSEALLVSTILTIIVTLILNVKLSWHRLS